jgi:hypothetical protein
MSEPIPESIPTSQDPRSKRPTKRLALTPTSAQAASLATLFSHPDREIPLPSAATTTKPSLPPPPEIVANVQGSSAGAGSGEFHVYKASRRREYERIKMMEEEVERENMDRDFERRRKEMRRLDEERTEKRRRKREKVAKRRGAGKKDGGGGGGGGAGGGVGVGGERGGEGEGEGEGKVEVMMDGGLGEIIPLVDEPKGVVIHDDDDDETPN